jgi:DNA-binding transcriptional ArsR family regulator
MEAIHVLDQSDQIKTLASPLRQSILEAMIAEPITTKQVAVRLGEKPTKLYHHVDALEKAGLIRLIRTQRKRGTTEKYFQAVARRFVVDRAAIEVVPEAEDEEDQLERVISTSLESTLAEIRDSLAVGLIRTDEEAGESVFIRSHLRASPQQMNNLIVQLQEWIRECQSSHDPNAGLEYGVTLAFYPTQVRQ